MAKKTLKNIMIRYGVATFGLILVAIGVALSLKSNLGTAPVSCPPAVLNLKWGAISVGTFTWMMHIIFILTQMILLGRKFKAEYLMQIPAAFVFGYLCDAAIWACQGIPAATYAARMALCLASVLLTAVGIHIEVIAGAWILAGDKLTDVIAQVSGTKFSNVKIVIDVVLVLLSAGFAWLSFRSFFGDGTDIVIREGTLILALLTGLCMKLTDPLVDRLFFPILKKADE
ncbi:MAG: hypothetical protein IJ578_08860 [Bacteroidales bacterium]|nr:hypothetical protein [Bacteroidales bacterium]